MKIANVYYNLVFKVQTKGLEVVVVIFIAISIVVISIVVIAQLQALLARSMLMELAQSSIRSPNAMIYAIEGSSRLSSVPISIIKVSKMSSKSLEESLLSFSQSTIYYLNHSLKQLLQRPLVQSLNLLLYISFAFAYSSSMYFYDQQPSFQQTQHRAFGLLLLSQRSDIRLRSQLQ